MVPAEMPMEGAVKDPLSNSSAGESAIPMPAEAGALALGYGGFSYTKETHQADVGPIHMSVDEKEYVNVPVWAGVAAIVVGGLLLFPGRKA